MTQGNENRALSTRYYGIDWTRYFPYRLSADETIEISSAKACFEFFAETQEQYLALNREEAAFLGDDFTSAKRSYYETAGDFFAFSEKGRVFGFFVGTPIDWSSYYLRFAWILPAWQGGGRWQAFLDRLLCALKENGVARVLVDVSPSNLGQVHTHNKLDFNVTGFQVSERWGALVQMTRFLSHEAEAAFLKLYCKGTKPQIRRA